MGSSKHLFWDGCDTVQLAQNYGTPLYVLSETAVRERCREVKKDFLCKYPNTRAVYASKAFLTMAMVRIIASEGLGLDVVSGGEIYTAYRAGFPMEKTIFHGNNKTLEELQLALETGVGRIVADSESELDIIEDAARRRGKRATLLLRVAPGVDAATHQYMATGHTASKFGFPLAGESISRTIQRIKGSENLVLKGFHFHVGSQLQSNRSHCLAVDALIKEMVLFSSDLGFVTEELNVGGGYGVPEHEGEERKPLKYFTEGIMERVIAGCEQAGIPVPAIIIEPGRWIVSEAGITLYKVGSIKEIPGVMTYVSVDGGMTDNPRPALYGAKYWGVVANRADELAGKKVTIVGKCCESGDVLMKDVMVTDQITRDDILAVFNTGAYNFSMANNYNRLPRPAVVLVREGNAYVIVNRQDYEDLLSGEVIPDHLR
ncbi:MULTISPECIES: diaminopimelate decarboxylase [Aminobacterium]|jgi:diaminopimelate decarboxylase|uniref:Diaminopimelate decarboxylase n=1 Tax=Aminobacterium colombiense (strain DSM 12261 / ALA-1) TaxID=572547 RepID=D5ECU2_AMICL|nr:MULTISPECIES: diaminopimelate decarboxylase [Aminobacterium]MDD2379174.1 diaminopimelate decarboxylase [Aminobacterium colombiense]ADE56374.1 diaminopimelate decarboxylase [Aminobacterium colombiense DSM 12261]MDD3767393.1 diaminopimelate decarboxylase [Aminobacterium colombiense]MDD4265407.1 diaminopimelate decarboxylase [Aminobacterium colombiense]MDD4586104.1 diaminopimelate decarboxylase [Aminobacterium colombiense]